MKLRQMLAGLFVASTLSLAYVPTGDSGTGRSLLAQVPSNCGGYTGQLCKSTTSCAWYVFGRICTTYYYYYPGPKDKPEDQPEAKNE